MTFRSSTKYGIFIGRMHAYGIRETSLKWFQSYLDRRCYRVLINNTFPSAHTLSCGVPQGPVLGTRMYTIYVAPLANVINNHSINYHCYADDRHPNISTMCKQYSSCTGCNHSYPRLHYRCIELDEQKYTED